MRVLMVSPHPVYSPRGTPISVFNRCQALCALGHEVDLVTYPVGEDLPVEGLRYLRATLPGVHKVAVGPSFAKFFLNGATTVRAFREGVRGRYDVVHTHEEAGLFGPALARLCRAPHVYDMGNDWADVLRNYGVGRRNPLTVMAATLENAVIRHSDAVIAHFPLIADRVVQGASTPVETVFNISLEADPDPALSSYIRSSWVADGSKIILYSGTLEPYQGVQLLLESMVELRHSPAVLVIAGGRPEQVDELQKRASELGVADTVRLLGTIPSTLIPAYLMAADVLVSPRERGRNTPLKVFSYLRSGRPIVATDIASHTQVLDEHSCVLVRPTAAGLADGIRMLLDDGPVRTRAVEGARVLQAEFGIERYVRGVARAYEFVGGGAVDEATVTDAADRIRAGGNGADPLASLAPLGATA
ncbi:MAG: glycosyltransferase family 4 protein [Acidimicrobiales bacterium]